MTPGETKRNAALPCPSCRAPHCLEKRTCTKDRTAASLLRCIHAQRLETFHHPFNKAEVLAVSFLLSCTRRSPALPVFVPYTERNFLLGAKGHGTPWRCRNSLQTQTGSLSLGPRSVNLLSLSHLNTKPYNFIYITHLKAKVNQSASQQG